MSRVLGRLGRRLVPRRWRRSARLEERLLAATGRRVIAGPFAGLAYVEKSFGSAYWPKLLGTYELELQGALEEMLTEGFDRVLVAGAGEGYYAVGLAHRLPNATVIAWEANPEARAAIVELARRNSVDARIEVRGICDARELNGALAGLRRALLLVDLDGGEVGLLDPEVVPGLLSVSLLVEVHDCFVTGLSDRLRERFDTSHEISFLAARARRGSDAPPLALPGVFSGALLQLLSENRPPGNDWLAMRPRNGSGA